jgi:CheY-like chemotaxis protein
VANAGKRSSVAPDAKHILVVNDTEEIVELFRDIIEGMGHRMSAMTYSPEELAAVREAEPDLVILDLMFGGEARGWQLVQKLRMAPDMAATPVIVCTADVVSAREREGWLLEQGIKVVLKPFSVSDLERAVTKAFDLPDLLEA